MSALTIIVPGRPASNNSVARFSRGRAHKGERAAQYEEFVRACALEAVTQSGWKVPECARVAVVLTNCWIDADNSFRSILNGLKVVAIADDDRAHVRGVSAEHAIDAAGPRVEITVTPCEPLPLAKKSRAKAKIDVKPPDVYASFAEVQAEARRRTAALPRSLDAIKSGDVIKSFAERDRVLAEIGMTKRGVKR